MGVQARVAEVAAIRTAGLPSSIADRMTFARTGALATSILDAEDDMRREGVRIADALHTVVGAENDPRWRRRLIELRRTLFTGRGPKPSQWDDDLAGRVPGVLGAEVARWVADHRALARARERLDTSLADERVEKAQDLLLVAGTEPFGRAMAMASPDLLDELRRWAAHPERPPKGAKLSRLAVYLVRATVKTSPFSFFALSRLASWTDDDPALVMEGAAGRAALEVDADYLDEIARALVSRPELDGALGIRVNPSAVAVGERVEFLGPWPREAVRAVPASSALLQALKVIADRPGTTRAELVSLLADASDGDSDAAVRFLVRLLDVGLAEAHLPVPDSAPDWLGACASWLADHSHDAGDGLTRIRLALAAASTELRRPVAPGLVDEHRSRCEAVRTALTAVTTELGVKGEGGRSPVLFENAVATPEARLGARWWRPVLDDLEALRPLLGLFDVHLPKRVATASLHAERFGAGTEVELLTLYRAVTETVVSGRTAGPATAAERAVVEAFGPADRTRSQDAMLGASSASELRELHDLRVRARAGLAGRPDDDGVVRLDPTQVRTEVPHWPAWLEAPSSLAFYVQLYEDGGRPAAVLNTAHSGHGRATARLRHLLDPESVRFDGDRPGESRAGADVRVMELAGRYGSTLNVRAATTPEEITYPFVTGSGADRAGVPWADLIAAHDRDSGVLGLRCAGSAGRVLPAHLGLMSTEYLPPGARFLAQVFGTDWHYHPGALTFVPFERLDADTPVVSFPRLAVGRVTIRRAGWLMAAAEVPRRAPGERDAAFLLRLGRWFRSHGIPERCFVRTWLPGSKGQGEAELSRVRTRRAKPLPYELTNWFLAPALERLVADASLVMFEERLPGPADAVRVDGESYVAEVVVELTAGNQQ